MAYITVNGIVNSELGQLIPREHRIGLGLVDRLLPEGTFESIATVFAGAGVSYLSNIFPQDSTIRIVGKTAGIAMIAVGLLRLGSSKAEAAMTPAQIPVGSVQGYVSSPADGVEVVPVRYFLSSSRYIPVTLVLVNRMESTVKIPITATLEVPEAVPEERTTVKTWNVDVKPGQEARRFEVPVPASAIPDAHNRRGVLTFRTGSEDIASRILFFKKG